MLRQDEARALCSICKNGIVYPNHRPQISDDEISLARSFDLVYRTALPLCLTSELFLYRNITSYISSLRRARIAFLI